MCLLQPESESLSEQVILQLRADDQAELVSDGPGRGRAGLYTP